jgi:hypothetical protein
VKRLRKLPESALQGDAMPEIRSMVEDSRMLVPLPRCFCSGAGAKPRPQIQGAQYPIGSGPPSQCSAIPFHMASVTSRPNRASSSPSAISSHSRRGLVYPEGAAPHIEEELSTESFYRERPGSDRL